MGKEGIPDTDVIGYIRKHIYESCTIAETHTVEYAAALKVVQTSMRQFIELMHNRIFMGRYRYGEFSRAPYADYTRDIKRSLRLYLSTRNTEYLVDMANYCWIEFRYGTHPDKHFTSVDDGEHSQV